MTIRLGVLAILLSTAATPAAAQDSLTLERIFGGGEFRSDLVSVTWLPGRAAYLVREEAAGGGSDVYRVDAASGARELLVRGAELLPPGADQPITIEEMTPSPDGRKLLVYTGSVRVWRRNTKGTYYVWDTATRRLIPVSGRPGYQQFAKFAPAGDAVGFVRDHDLFVTDLVTGQERRLTFDGSETVINGTTDWVYEEELDLRDAFRFSPDGRRIAFWRFDQSAIRPFYLVDETPLYPVLTPVRYPKAGEPNSTVRIGVVDVEGGDPLWMDLGPDPDVYIAAMDFAASPDTLWFTRLNRHQNRLELVLAEVGTGTTRTIMADSDAAWVDAEEPRWIRDGREFVLRSERGGYAQLHLFRRDGTWVRPLTPASWDVTTVHGVDERRGLVYFGGVGEGPRTRDVYRVGLDGRGLRRLSEGAGSHAADFDPTFAFFVETHSRAGVPPVQTLRRADGRPVRTLADNAVLRGKVAALGLVQPEFLTVPAADGTPLEAWVLKPPDFDPARRYPLLLYVYGGPGSQTVTDAWGGNRYLWHQLLAQHGYLVASVDNRGTGARGRAFKKQTYRRLGQLESADQIAAARYLGALPYVDAARIGIWGWSYGGYMSALTMLLGEGVFRAAIAVAPVTDWRFYDTIYTERFMRTPAENPLGYERGAPLTYADRLRGRLLLVHGTGDDNVHAQNTMQLVARLEDANKQFDLRLYPNKTHGIAGRATQLNLYGYFTQWLDENLRGQSHQR